MDGMYKMSILSTSRYTFWAVYLLVVGVGLADGFSFNTSTPVQCGQMTVQWDGGTEPFQLSLVPTIAVPGGRIRNITIPTGLSRPYSYSFELNEPAGLEFLASMSDGSGFGTGGTTGVLRVGSSSNNACIDNNLQYSFFFQTSTNSPIQCNPLTVTWPNNVTVPVNLYGLIPSGTAFRLPISQNPSVSTSYDWPVNIAQGTQFLLYMSDGGQAQTGGSTPLLTVGGGSTNCMNSTSPRSGGTATSGTGTGTGSGASASASVSGVGGGSSGGAGNNLGNNNNNGGGGGSSTPVGAIAGGVVGGVAFLVLLAVTLFFCLRKRSRERRASNGDSTVLKNYGAPPSSGEKSGRFDILGGLGARGGTEKRKQNARRWSDNETRVGEEGYEPSPFRYPSPPASTQPGAGAGAGAGLGLTGAMAGMGGAGAMRKENEVAEERRRTLLAQSGGLPPVMSDTEGTTRPSWESSRTPTRSFMDRTQTRSQGHTPPRGQGYNQSQTDSSLPRTPTGREFPPSAYPAIGNNSNGGYKPSSPLIGSALLSHPGQGHGTSQNSEEAGGGSQADRTDMATLGHGRDEDPATGNGLGLGRGNSTRKTGLGLGALGAGSGMNSNNAVLVPASPTASMPNRRSVEDPAGGGDEGGGVETRFVQHEDVGPVVDLPPRYDQLRARNPDAVQA